MPIHNNNNNNSNYFRAWAETWRRVWEDGKKLTPKKLNDLFRKKSHFLRENFLITIFSHRPYLSVFCLSPVSTVWNLYITTYMALFLTKKPLFQKEILTWHLFLVCSYFVTHPRTLLLEIMGGRMHGPSPNSNFGGPSPQSPLSLRPCFRAVLSLQWLFFWKVATLERLTPTTVDPLFKIRGRDPSPQDWRLCIHHCLETELSLQSKRLLFLQRRKTIVIVISTFLKRYSKAKRTRAPAYLRALRRIKGGFPKGGLEKLRSDFQSTRRGQSSF